MELLRYSVIIIYGFGFGFPALLGATFKLFASQMTIAQVNVYQFRWYVCMVTL